MSAPGREPGPSGCAVLATGAAILAAFLAVAAIVMAATGTGPF